MYKIGEFSKITGLSIKALRYYDKEKILEPSCRDEESAYRFYDEDNYSRAMEIKLLRELDFSIAEIKDTFSIYEDNIDFNCILNEKRQFIEKSILQQKKQLAMINSYIKPSDAKKIQQQYDIKLEAIKAITVASIRYTANYDECGKYFSTLYKAVKGKAAGAPINCYYDEEYKEMADIESCVPIKSHMDFKDKLVKCRLLPDINAITTIHRGDYKTMHLAYKALVTYAHDNGLQCEVSIREIYEKGPGMIFKGNPNKYITKVILPIK